MFEEIATSYPQGAEFSSSFNGDSADKATSLTPQDSNLVLPSIQYDDIAPIENVEFGNQKRNLLIGDSSNDLIYAGSGNDLVFGKGGNNVLFGENGRDYLVGGADDDIFFGGNGRDLLIGSNGNDLLFGEKGADYLNGGDGEDVLKGGAGNDTLRGGHDKDIFVIGLDGGRDIIRDFEVGIDYIGLADGLTLDHLAIKQTRGHKALIQEKASGKTLAILEGVNGRSISADDFVLADDLHPLEANSQNDELSVVGNWNTVFLQAAQDAGAGTPVVARLGAILNLSIYDSVNGLNRQNDWGTQYEQYAVDFEDAPELKSGRRSTAQDAAAIGAAHEALVNLLPDQRTSFDVQLIDSLRTVSKREGVTQGFKWGRSVSTSILELRADDGSDASDPYTPRTEIGGYDGTWGSQQYRNVTPFAIESVDQFEVDGPPDLTSEEYAESFDEVKRLGELNSTERTEDQSEAAKFWQQAGGTTRPTGTWFKITTEYDENVDLTTSEASRLFALTGLAIADSVVFVWDTKADFAFWRPRDAVRSADLDGNPLTEADTNWEAFRGVGNQGSSPDYLSGQGTFSGAGS
ncbi:MAG: hypothetical protein AAFQ76_17505, partial [Cyanobacteria bacterium J06626_26]